MNYVIRDKSGEYFIECASDIEAFELLDELESDGVEGLVLYFGNVEIRRI